MPVESTSLLVCNAVSTRLDKAQHLFCFVWIVWGEKEKKEEEEKEIQLLQ